MIADDLGTWEPLDVTEVVALFQDAPFRWWIAGGHALERDLGRRWRTHDDVDVGILRSAAGAVNAWLEERDWDLWLAAAGRLVRWDGAALDPDRSHNNIWVRRRRGGPWALDLTVGEGDATTWRYRRDPAITRPWDEAVLADPAGVPYLAPELQLLFKSKTIRAKDQIDAEKVIPELTAEQRSFLRSVLPDEHRWRSLLRS